ncbi:MAG: ABC transporter ATP-binding protein [Candidatus Heimdallarchaeum endolithica]|uniref:Molybdate/tungstate import ATP-binding protein WtpC n=1 Tax=Candidatus Heimdallarchaeum endolithica TaxID=2876572 RepID=A0A9Y1BT38_9ARCH|nr:MAG: ABC transporter ATP-binding protein [Candidatus Heimdallarchaeum endolithica]
MTEIQFKHVTKIFGKKVEAVKDLSFIIEDGEYVSLIGPSGCGKTTTLRLLAGTVLPTRGKIFFDNEEVEKLPIQKRNLGFVFQHFAIFPHMNVWENIAYGPTVKGKRKSEIEELVEHSLSSVQMKKRAESFPSELSAPELQKVSLARVIAAEAKILLLDEPLGALDQKIREEFQFFLRDFVKKQGLTAIHVTHDQAEALSISDKVIVLNKGQLIQMGTPEDLIFSPTNLFTSFFVGESDFIEGYILDDSTRFSKVRVGLESVYVQNAGISKGERVVIAIRREFFDVKKPNKNNENFLTGKIISDKFLGLFRRVKVLLKNQQIIEAKIHAKSPIKFKENETVHVIIDPSRTRCFEFPKEGIQKSLEM